MKNISSVVEKYSDLILKAERDLWKMPEPGYFEYKTNDYLIKAFEKVEHKLKDLFDSQYDPRLAESIIKRND